MKKVLIFYEYFYPAYKAGGPIQSIANLCRTFKDEFDFYIVCNNYDYGETKELIGIQTNCWNDFENQTAKVYYISQGVKKTTVILKIIRYLKPHVIMVNGLFSPVFSLAPLIFGHSKKIISVRGMLHPGALSQKSFKKKLFIFLLKKTGVIKKVVFHTTDEKESEFAKNIFGKKITTVAIQNFTNKASLLQKTKKQTGFINLVTVALISPMKNHALTLLALKNVASNVHYDIYGPVKDEKYWRHCLQIIDTLSPNITVTHKGSIDPQKVSSALVQGHCLVMPSKSENFSHAIYESLSSGIPVITSHFTPWNDLEKNKAGFNVDISDLKTITSAIETLALFNDEEYRVWSASAIAYAEKSIDIDILKIQYRNLLN